MYLHNIIVVKCWQVIRRDAVLNTGLIVTLHMTGTGVTMPQKSLNNHQSFVMPCLPISSLRLTRDGPNN
jgi:hypothetical protein